MQIGSGPEGGFPARPDRHIVNQAVNSHSQAAGSTAGGIKAVPGKPGNPRLPGSAGRQSAVQVCHRSIQPNPYIPLLNTGRSQPLTEVAWAPLRLHARNAVEGI